VTTYFFDVTQGKTLFADSEGADLADDVAAKEEAKRILGDMIRDRFSGSAAPGNDRCILAARTADAGTLFTMTLTLRTRPGAKLMLLPPEPPADLPAH